MPVKTREQINRQYRKSKKGVISRAYCHMKYRVSGRKKDGHSNYLGLTILEREEFVAWSNSSKDLDYILEEWERNNYEYKYAPSVDRLNPKEGYELWNINWCTMSENTTRMMQMRGVM